MGGSSKMKMLSKVLFLCLMLCCLFASGCSSAKSPSKENFKKAVAEWAKDNAGFYQDTKEFPFKIGIMEDFPNRGLFQKMVKAGVLNAKETHPGGTSYYVNNVLQNAIIFSISDQGMKFFVKDKGLKAANLEVLEVLQFTEPAPDSTGSKASTVKYKCKVIPTELMKLLNSEAKEETAEYDIKVVLTNDGWKVWK